MTAKELRDYLKKQFNEKLSPFGFKKIENNYVLTEEGKTYSITFNSLNYDNSYPTSFSAFSGFIIVNKVLQTALGVSKKKVDKIKVAGQIYLRQVSLWEQGKYPCQNYDIYTLQEAEKAVTEIIDYFLNIIIPEFRKIKDLNDLDVWFNMGQYMLTSKRLKLDIMYALIVAKLVSNPNYDLLVSKYKKISNHFSNWDKQELQKVFDFLDSNTIEDFIVEI